MFWCKKDSNTNPLGYAVTLDFFDLCAEWQTKHAMILKKKSIENFKVS